MVEPTEIGEWRKVAELGAGGFGVVTLWRNKVTNDSFAVKKCKMAMPSSLTPRQKERWKHEVEIMKRIKNDNIVCFRELPELLYYELNKYNPTKLPLLSMEYCSKGSLRTYLKACENIRGLQEVEVRYILSDICNGIQHLHSMDITHRDIKPDNIVMQCCNERPNKMVYKIIDLGYAKELGTMPSFVGTLAYLAPEIFQTESYTKNVDYWSFGMTTYEIITGELPFLPTWEPPRRFEYIRKKSEEDICIYPSKNGTPINYKEIVRRVWISSLLKKDLESWLRLVLQFDPKKRGTYRNKPEDVISMLKAILAKKIVKVFFVSDLKIFSYEVTESSTFGDLKNLLSVYGFPPKDLVVLYEGQNDIHEDNEKVLECINSVDHTSEFYIFNRKFYIDTTKNVSFPTDLEELYKSRTDFNSREIRKLTLHLIFFILSQRNLLELFNKSIQAQITFTEYMFDEYLSKKLFEKIRNDLAYLMAKIESYDELNNNLSDKVSKESWRCMNNFRKLLRQTKELIENVNGMAEKFLQFSAKKEEITGVITTVKSLLTKNNFNDFLTNAISLYQRIPKFIQSSDDFVPNNSNQVPIHIELARILSQLLKVWRKNVITNSDIAKLTQKSLNMQKSLRKHYTWCMALDREIYRVTKELKENQRSINQRFTNDQGAQNDGLVSIVFPSDFPVGFLEATALMRENRELRCTIQEKLDETSLMFGKIQREILMLYNGVSMRYSDI